jgi:hypothetical protein
MRRVLLGVSYTRRELDVAGAVAEDAPNLGNYGHFVLTLDRGHFKMTGPPFGSKPNVRFGTYAVTGDKVIFSPSDQSSPGSNTEHWHYTWSVYRDSLMFKKRGPAPTASS